MTVKWVVNKDDQVIAALVDDIVWSIPQVVGNIHLHEEYHEFLKTREKKNGCPYKEAHKR